MKKLILLATCLGMMTAVSFAQSSDKTETRTKKSKSTTYVCPKCHATSNKAGNCMKCNVAMVKDGTYYCTGCGATSDKPMKCAKCNMDMVKITAK